MEKRDLTFEEMENVNGAGVGDAILEVLKFFFDGISTETKNSRD